MNGEDGLQIRAPKGSLSSEDLRILGQCKDSIRALMSLEAGPWEFEISPREDPGDEANQGKDKPGSNGRKPSQKPLFD